MSSKPMTILQDFAGKLCSGCGSSKIPNHSFCRQCYMRLPLSMRKTLYARFGEGYEEAFEAARELLRPGSLRLQPRQVKP
jgi:hypothetical protein